MCPPVVIAAVAAATSIAGTIVNANAQAKAADANEDAARRARDAATKAATHKQFELLQDVGQSTFFTERRARAARSLARVGAGEAGVAGVSAQAVLNDIERESADAKRTTRRQADRDVRGLERAKLAEAEVMRGRIAAVGRPSPLAVGLQIAGAGLSFAQFQITDRSRGLPETEKPTS